MPRSVSWAIHWKYAVAFPVAAYVLANPPRSTGTRNRGERLPVVSVHDARVAHSPLKLTAMESGFDSPPARMESRRPVVERAYCTGGTTSSESKNTAESVGFAVSLTVIVSTYQPVAVVESVTMGQMATPLPVPVNVTRFCDPDANPKFFLRVAVHCADAPPAPAIRTSVESLCPTPAKFESTCATALSPTCSAVPGVTTSVSMYWCTLVAAVLVMFRVS